MTQSNFESSRVWTFVVGAELAVQSQQRRWDDGTRHPQLQTALSSAGTDEWVLRWRLNEASDSSGDRRAVGIVGSRQTSVRIIHHKVGHKLVT